MKKFITFLICVFTINSFSQPQQVSQVTLATPQSASFTLSVIGGTNTVLSATNFDNPSFLAWAMSQESGTVYSNINRYSWQDTYRRIANRQNITIMRAGDGLGGGGMLQGATQYFPTNHSTLAGVWLPIFPTWYAASGSGTHYQLANQNGMVLCNADALITTGDTVVYSDVGGTGNSMPANIYAIWYITGPGFGHFKVETNISGGGYSTAGGFSSVSSASASLSSAIIWVTNLNGVAPTTVRITGNDTLTNIIVSVSAINTLQTNGFYYLPWVGSSTCTWSNKICTNQNILAPFFAAADPAIIVDESITWDQEAGGSGDSTPYYNTWLDFWRTNNPRANYIECGIYPLNPDTSAINQNFRMFTNCYGRNLGYFDGHSPMISYNNMLIRGWQSGDGTHASVAGYLAYDTLLYYWMDLWNSEMLMPYLTSTPYVRVTGSDATTTGQSLANVTGLSLPLNASTTYEIEASLSATTSADVAGIKYGVNFSTAGATIEAQIAGSLNTTNVVGERISALNTATANAFLQGASQNGQVFIKGIVTTGINTGNLTVQHLKVTSGTSTVRINSYLKATKLP